LKETRIGLKILEMANLFPDKDKLNKAISESNELIAIFITSVNTALNKNK